MLIYDHIFDCPGYGSPGDYMYSTKNPYFGDFVNRLKSGCDRIRISTYLCNNIWLANETEAFKNEMESMCSILKKCDRLTKPRNIDRKYADPERKPIVCRNKECGTVVERVERQVQRIVKEMNGAAYSIGRHDPVSRDIRLGWAILSTDLQVQKQELYLMHFTVYEIARLKGHYTDAWYYRLANWIQSYRREKALEELRTCLKDRQAYKHRLAELQKLTVEPRIVKVQHVQEPVLRHRGSNSKDGMRSGIMTPSEDWIEVASGNTKKSVNTPLPKASLEPKNEITTLNEDPFLATLGIQDIDFTKKLDPVIAAKLLFHWTHNKQFEYICPTTGQKKCARPVVSDNSKVSVETILPKQVSDSHLTVYDMEYMVLLCFIVFVCLAHLGIFATEKLLMVCGFM